MLDGFQSWYGLNVENKPFKRIKFRSSFFLIQLLLDRVCYHGFLKYGFCNLNEVKV